MNLQVQASDALSILSEQRGAKCKVCPRGKIISKGFIVWRRKSGKNQTEISPVLGIFSDSLQAVVMSLDKS